MAKTNGEVYTSWKDRLSAFSKVCTLMQGTGQCRCALKDRFPLAPNKVACVLGWLNLPASTVDAPAENCPLCESKTIVSQVGEAWFVQCNCGYRSARMRTRSEAVRIHNELYHKAKQVEVVNGKD